MNLPNKTATLALGVVMGIMAVEISNHDGRPAYAQAAPPCNNYSSNVTPPVNIGVAITYAGGPITDVVFPNFKSYVKDVLPYEWLTDWSSASYQAGAVAVKTFGWYHTIHWRGNTFPGTGECYHVVDYDSDQVYCAGIGTPGSGANCHGLGTRPASHATATSYAVEQTWNWLLQAGGVIYPTYYKAGNPTDACGQWYGGPADGRDMSQNGSQACALAEKSWVQIASTYYFANWEFPSEHIYGQWHGALTWGSAPWTPVSVSPSAGSNWRFRSLNSCGGPTVTPFDYGLASDIKIVGDWDGNLTHSQGIVRLSGGALCWHLRNTRSAGPADAIFQYGAAGDIPVVGDWDANGTWTIGIRRGPDWHLRNTNSLGPADAIIGYGSGGDIPIPGKWVATSGVQTVTIGIVRLSGVALQWHLRHSNTSGNANNIFNYGAHYDRPITGDWQSGGLTQFGPGVVRDGPIQPCPGASPDQFWHLRNSPSPGPANAIFGYEVIRP